jgi:hypothetical protein
MLATRSTTCSNAPASATTSRSTAFSSVRRRAPDRSRFQTSRGRLPAAESAAPAARRRAQLTAAPTGGAGDEPAARVAATGALGASLPRFAQRHDLLQRRRDVPSLRGAPELPVDRQQRVGVDHDRRPRRRQDHREARWDDLGVRDRHPSASQGRGIRDRPVAAGDRSGHRGPAGRVLPRQLRAGAARDPALYLLAAGAAVSCCSAVVQNGQGESAEVRGVGEEIDSRRSFRPLP